MSVSTIYKKAMVTALVGLGTIGVAGSASAHTFVRCDYDGDRCVRIHCDWDGDDCWRESVYYNRPYYSGSGRWACDEDGDDCRWVYYHRPYYHPYYDGYYYGPNVSLGFRF